MNATMIAANNIAKREYQKEYLEYWNSTKDITGTGRPVDALISPLAPFPAARREGYSYYGYSTFVNLLDYTSCVFPVTTADKNVDVMDKDFRPLSDEDKEVAAGCENMDRPRALSSGLIENTDDPEIFDGAHVGVQLIGRRLQEEKVLALAEYLGDKVKQ